MTIIAQIDVCGGIYCPHCGSTMYEHSDWPDLSKRLVTCPNPDCDGRGKKYLAPVMTIELTPLEDH